MLLLLACVPPAPVVTTLPLAPEVVSETRTLEVQTRVVADDEWHHIVAVRPQVRITRVIRDPVRRTTKVGAKVSEETVSTERTDESMVAWGGSVSASVGGQVLTQAAVEDGEARLDLRLGKWSAEVQLAAGPWTGTVSLPGTRYGQAWLGKLVTEGISTGRLREARDWLHAYPDVPGLHDVLVQRWCEAALDPARLAAARDDVDRFGALLEPADDEGACRTLRDSAGDVASVQAGLALGSGDRELTERWAQVLRGVGEISRAERIEAGLRR